MKIGLPFDTIIGDCLETKKPPPPPIPPTRGYYKITLRDIFLSIYVYLESHCLLGSKKKTLSPSPLLSLFTRFSLNFRSISTFHCTTIGMYKPWRARLTTDARYKTRCVDAYCNFVQGCRKFHPQKCTILYRCIYTYSLYRVQLNCKH